MCAKRSLSGCDGEVEDFVTDTSKKLISLRTRRKNGIECPTSKFLCALNVVLKFIEGNVKIFRPRNYLGSKSFFSGIKRFICAFKMIYQNLNVVNQVTSEIKGLKSLLCKQSSCLIFVYKQCKNLGITISLTKLTNTLGKQDKLF